MKRKHQLLYEKLPLTSILNLLYSWLSNRGFDREYSTDSRRKLLTEFSETIGRADLLLTLIIITQIISEECHCYWILFNNYIENKLFQVQNYYLTSER